MWEGIGSVGQKNGRVKGLGVRVIGGIGVGDVGGVGEVGPKSAEPCGWHGIWDEILTCVFDY